MSTKQKIESWKNWISQCRVEIDNLIYFKDFFKNLEKILDKCTISVEKEDILYWFQLGFGNTVALGVRRQTDDDDRSKPLSLINLLKKIKKEPEVLAREYFVEGRLKGVSETHPTIDGGVAPHKKLYKQHSEEKYDKLVGETLPYPTEKMIEQDINELKNTTKKVNDFVDKHIAHADRNAKVYDATYRDLYVALDKLDGILNKYSELIEMCSLYF